MTDVMIHADPAATVTTATSTTVGNSSSRPASRLAGHTGLLVASPDAASPTSSNATSPTAYHGINIHGGTASEKKNAAASGGSGGTSVEMTPVAGRVEVKSNALEPASPAAASSPSSAGGMLSPDGGAHAAGPSGAGLGGGGGARHQPLSKLPDSPAAGSYNNVAPAGVLSPRQFAALAPRRQESDHTHKANAHWWAGALFAIFVLFVVMDCFQIVGRLTVDDGRTNTQRILGTSWAFQIIGLITTFGALISVGWFMHPFTRWTLLILFFSFVCFFSSAALYTSKTTVAFLEANANVLAACVLEWVACAVYFIYLNCLMWHMTDFVHKQIKAVKLPPAPLDSVNVTTPGGLEPPKSSLATEHLLQRCAELSQKLKDKQSEFEQTEAAQKKLALQVERMEEQANKQQSDLVTQRERAEQQEAAAAKATREVAALEEKLGAETQNEQQLREEVKRLGLLLNKSDSELQRLSQQLSEENKDLRVMGARLEAEKAALAKQLSGNVKQSQTLAGKAEELLFNVDEQEGTIAKNRETIAALRDENKKIRDELVKQKVVLEAEKGELHKRLKQHGTEQCAQEKRELQAQVDALREAATRSIDPTGSLDPARILHLHPLFKNLKMGGSPTAAGAGDETKSPLGSAATSATDPTRSTTIAGTRGGQLPALDLQAQLNATQVLLASVVKEHAQCEPLRTRCTELERDLATCEKHWSAAQRELARSKAEQNRRIAELENEVVVYEEQLGALRGDSEIRADLVREAQEQYRTLRPQLGCEFMPGPKNGVRLTSVMPGKSAEAAGLQVHDIVEQVNAKETRTKEQFKAAVSSIMPGDSVPFQIERGREILTVVVQVGTAGMTHQQIMDLRRCASGMVKDSDIRIAKQARQAAQAAALPPSTA